MLPAPFAISQVQGPKVWKANAKIAVPMRKTTKPIRLNFMNRAIQVFALSLFLSFMPGTVIYGLLDSIQVSNLEADKG